MSDIASRLRQTRADMLGTPDETHYWDCAAAADEIERLCKALDTAEETRETYKAMSLRETMENKRLRAENEKLRAALKPFAGFSARYTQCFEETSQILLIKVCDLRAAAAALNAENESHNLRNERTQ